MKSKSIYLAICGFCFVLCILIVLLMAETPAIRGFVGDIIIIPLIYCGIKAFRQVKPLKLSMIVLLISYVVECLQYFNIVEVLGLGHSQIARIVIGTTFDWRDLGAYTLGGILIYLLDSRVIAPICCKQGS